MLSTIAFYVGCFVVGFAAGAGAADLIYSKKK